MGWIDGGMKQRADLSFYKVLKDDKTGEVREVNVEGLPPMQVFDLTPAKGHRWEFNGEGYRAKQCLTRCGICA